MKSTTVTARSRRLVADRSGGVCEICGQAFAVELSHRRPVSMGGTRRTDLHRPAWLIHTCHACHQGVGPDGQGGVERNRSRAQTMGWLLTSEQDALTVPAWLTLADLWIEGGRWTDTGGWWLLDDEGSSTRVEPVS